MSQTLRLKLDYLLLCWPSYKTIGEAVGMCANTVSKYIQKLIERGLIAVEPTKVTTKAGVTRNGTLQFTLLPPQNVIARYYEEKLAELILQMKAEIAALRSEASTEYPDGVSPKKKAIAAYLREYPGVTNKAKIARDLNMDRTTVQRYYDEVRAELRGEESPVPQT